MKKLFILTFITIAAIYAVACSNKPVDTSVSDNFEASVSSQEVTDISYAESTESEISAESANSESVSELVLDVPSKDTSKEASTEKPETEASQDISEEVPEDVFEDVLGEISENISEDVSEDISEDVSEDVSETETCDPTELELEALRLINIEREKEGLAPLVFAAEIYDCASIRGEEILVCWGHTRPDGTNFRTVYEENNFNWKKYWTGENLAGRFKTMEKAIEALMNSEGHRKNILCPNYTAVAISVKLGSDGKYYMAQLFLG